MNSILILILVILNESKSDTGVRESSLPMLFIAVDPTESEKYTLPAIGEVSLLWPKTRSLRVKCLSDYSVYWDSSVAIQKYLQPVWYEYEISQHSEPVLQSNDSKYLMEATFIIAQTTVGYISCQSIQQPSLRSRINIHGQAGRNYINAKYPRSGKYQVKEVLETCGTDYVLYNNIMSEESPSLTILENNTWFTDFPQLGLFFRTPLFQHTDEIIKCVGVEMSSIHLEIFRNVTNSIPETTMSNTRRSASHVLSTALKPVTDDCTNPYSCRLYECSNPFECDIKLATSTAQNCTNEKISELQNGMRTLECNARSSRLTEYFFNGVDKNLYWFPRKFPSKSLLELTTPEYQIFVLDEFARVSCAATVFMLSRPIIFALQYKNQSVKYLRDSDENGKTENGVVVRNITIYVDEDLQDVICMSPWFTFDRWITNKMPIEPKIDKLPFVWIEVVKDGKKYNEIDSCCTNNTSTYKIHGPFQTTSIKCVATGFPAPNITWIHKPLDDVLTSIDKNLTHSWIALTFRKVSLKATGIYTCEVTNVHGEANATITLIFDDRASNSQLVIIIAVCGVIILLLIFGLGIYWRKFCR